MTQFREGWKGIVIIFQNTLRRLIIYLLETYSERQVITPHLGYRVNSERRKESACKKKKASLL